MKKIAQTSLFILFLMLLISAGVTACLSTQSESSKTLEEAKKVHLNALEVEKKVSSTLKQLVQRKNSINVQGRALTEEEKAFVEKVEKLETDLAYWRENLIEVPGLEHDHSHDHDGHHHHHNAPDPQLTDQEILDAQNVFLESIKEMEKRGNEMMTT